MADPGSRGADWIKPHLTRVAMLIVLAGSLLWAYAISDRQTQPHNQTTTVHPMGMTVELPGQWTTLGDPPAITGATDATTYVSRPLVGHALTFARLTDTSLRSPSVALDAAVTRWLGERAQPDGEQTRNTVIGVATDTLTGRIYGAIQPTADGLVIHVLSAVTVDGHDYRFIAYQHHTTRSPDLTKELSAAIQLTRDLVAQMDGQSTRTPDESMLRSAGLVGWSSHPQMRAVAPDDTPRYAAPIMIPAERAGQLQVWRVRLDTDITDPSAGLDPGRLMSEHFLHAAGRPHRQGEIWTGTVLGQQVWRIAHVMAERGLVRQLIYMRLPHQRAVLIELIAEPGVVPLAASWLEVLARQAAALLPDGDTLPLQDGAPLEGFIERGRGIVQRQYAVAAERLTPGWEFTLIESDGAPIGCQVTETRTSENPRYPVHGNVLTLLFKPEHVRIVHAWESSETADRWICQTKQQIGPADAPSPRAAQVRLGADSSTFSMIVGNNNTAAVNLNTPQALVAQPLEEYWPADAGLSESDPAIVWMTHGIGPPRPYWIRLAPQAADAAPLDALPGSRTMLIRSPLSIDPDVATLDRQGRIVRYVSKRMTPLLPGVTITTRSIDRPTLIRTFPAMQGLLGSWQTEPSSHNDDPQP